MTLEEAGRRAGYTSDPGSIASRTLKKPSVQEAFREAMEKHPALKRESIVQKLAEGLEAEQIKFFAHEGNVQDERTTTDFGVRHAYLALIAKLGGLEPSTKTELTVQPLNPGGALLDLSWISKEHLIKLIALAEYPILPPSPPDQNPIIDAEVVPSIIAGATVGAAGEIASAGETASPEGPVASQEPQGEAEQAAGSPDTGS